MRSHDGLKKPDAVFFDWDGTLVDTFCFLNDAHSCVLMQLGFEPFKNDEFKGYFGQPREKLYRTIYKDKFEEAKALFEIYVMENNHKINPLEGAEALLVALHGLDIPMGVVSNKKASFIQKECENFGWTDFFLTYVGAGEADEDKPSGAPLVLALERSGISAKDKHIWYVGDTENDLACAKNAGCELVFIKGHDDTKRLMDLYKPCLSVDNCTHLREFLVAF